MIAWHRRVLGSHTTRSGSERRLRDEFRSLFRRRRRPSWLSTVSQEPGTSGRKSREKDWLTGIPGTGDGTKTGGLLQLR
jgi:hypothetical protein